MLTFPISHWAKAEGLPATASLPQSGSIVARWLLDEASGSRADSVGSTTLTDNNTVGSGTGYDGNSVAADFEFSNAEYLENTSPDAGLKITSSYSVSAWVKVESFSDSGFVFIKGNSSNGDTDYHMRIYTDGKIEIRHRAGTSNIQTQSNTGEITIGTWYHVTIVHDDANDQHRIYKNGSLIKTGTGITSNPNSSTNTNIVLGRHPIANANKFDGMIQDVIVWSAALSNTDASNLYNKY